MSNYCKQQNSTLTTAAIGYGNEMNYKKEGTFIQHDALVPPYEPVSAGTHATQGK